MKTDHQLRQDVNDELEWEPGVHASEIDVDVDNGAVTLTKKVDVPADGRPLPLESSVPGVFAVGDVRSGSVKRVGGAIGEGAAVVAQLHLVLAERTAAVPGA